MMDMLPNELLQHIFSFAALDRKHTASLWTSARQVSKPWRVNMAKVYLDLFILTPGRCNIFCGRYDAIVMRISKVLMLELFFDRLEGTDNDRCVFKEDPKSTGRPSKGASEDFKRSYESKKGRLWKRALDQYLGIEEGKAVRRMRYEHPAHIISIYGHSLDSPLPGLEYDIEKRELSFQWEPMFTAFFLEQHELGRLSEGLESYSELADRFAAEQLRPYSGHLRIALMAKRLRQAAANKEKIMTKVRRQRIVKQYQRQHREKGFEFEHDSEIEWKDEPVYVGKIVAANGAGTGRDRTHVPSTHSGSNDEDDEGNNLIEGTALPDSDSSSSGGYEHHDLSDID
ncbi:hypothetical protein DOTSEDRAFT_74705 [Dothistroma septosporum NZE10]|uniref:F-box domain-containing protein n=1 Tax=Dothistroma septosporum (strain NZE10 / CBS 128990) TaxID=675120 RepID=N1PF32_DOTSN|nr:hypothetical protein DOTSEDRAFT_74705 [Dothistroma septosporum NZE10]